MTEQRPNPLESQNLSTVDPSADVINTKRERPLIFISHRHADAEIATRVSTWIKTASDRVELFQSSDGLRGVTTGRNITSEIQRAVAEAAVMLVVYTDDDADWAWVMFEMGIAKDPTNPVTTVVILQCADDFPTVLSEFKRVKLSSEADRVGFTKDLMTTACFPTHKDWILRENDPDTVRALATGLWETVKGFVPPSQLRRNWHPQAVINIEMALNDVSSESVEVHQRIEFLESIIPAQGRVIEELNIGGMFAVNTLVGRRLAELAHILAEKKQDAWLQGLYRQLARCMVGLRPDMPLPRLAVEGGTEYQLIVTKVQERWFERVVRFELQFLPLLLLQETRTEETKQHD